MHVGAPRQACRCSVLPHASSADSLPVSGPNPSDTCIALVHAHFAQAHANAKVHTNAVFRSSVTASLWAAAGLLTGCTFSVFLLLQAC